MEIAFSIFDVPVSCGKNPIFCTLLEKNTIHWLFHFLTCNVTDVGASTLQMPGVIIAAGSILYNFMLSSTVP